MRRLAQAALAGLILPFLAACFTAQPTPLPAPGARGNMDVRGVVFADTLAVRPQIEYSEVYSVVWGARALTINGLLKAPEDDASTAGPVQRDYRYSDLSGVLVRRLDADRTSLLIGATAITAVSVIVFFFAERSGSRTGVTPGG